jgi:hypothetical protein
MAVIGPDWQLSAVFSKAGAFQVGERSISRVRAVLHISAALLLLGDPPRALEFEKCLVDPPFAEEPLLG